MIKSVTTAIHSFAIWLVGLLGLGAEFASYVYIVLVSMVPLIELRGAIPLAMALDMPLIPSFIVSIIGNLVPIPFILLLIKKICSWMKTTKYLSKIPLYLERKVEKNKDKVTKYAKWGLFIFVAIPLPGTGAWSGALIASFLDFNFKDSIIAITGGVISAGIIMSIFSYGLLGLIF
ncbi:MAG: small multi-drug export protein [Clostridia bacterium]|nr:small multi-drug export protein [Clostridia bacterium]